MGVWKINFLSKWVIGMFQPFILQGVNSLSASGFHQRKLHQFPPKNHLGWEVLQRIFRGKKPPAPGGTTSGSAMRSTVCQRMPDQAEVAARIPTTNINERTSKELRIKVPATNKSTSTKTKIRNPRGDMFCQYSRTWFQVASSHRLASEGRIYQSHSLGARDAPTIRHIDPSISCVEGYDIRKTCFYHKCYRIDIYIYIHSHSSMVTSRTERSDMWYVRRHRSSKNRRKTLRIIGPS